MHRLSPLAMLAMATISEARFGLLSPRQNQGECCPCPAPGSQNKGPGPETVTVTQPAQTTYVTHAEQTVTVERTVSREPQTVYVTHPNSAPSGAPSGAPSVGPSIGPSVGPSIGPSVGPSVGPSTGPSAAPSGASQLVITVSPQPGQTGPQTVTVENGHTSVVLEQQPQQLQTVTILNSSTHSADQPSSSASTNPPSNIPVNSPPPAEEGPKTVTVEAKPPVKVAEVVTITQGQPPSGSPQSPTVVTITQGLPPSAGPQSPNVATVTPNSEPSAPNSPGAPAAESPKTVILTKQPDNSQPAQQATVTSPPQAQTVTQTVDHFQTLTKTLAGGGGDNIEIIIINIYTGETSCKKKNSGKPCNGGGKQYIAPAASGSVGPAGVQCPNINTTTSIATVYNTVLVTVLPNGNATAIAPASISQSTATVVMGRVPRAPASVLKW